LVCITYFKNFGNAALSAFTRAGCHQPIGGQNMRSRKIRVQSRGDADKNQSEPGERLTVMPWLRMLLGMAFLMAVWLGWSGFLKPHLLILGLVSCAIVIVIAARMGSFREESYWFRVIPRIPGFWFWLIRQVVKSNLQVAAIILSRRPAISPTLVTIKALPTDDLGQATLGNCITLTPGTVTLDDHEGSLLVHALTQRTAAELVEGEMNRRVAAFTRV
jgi:multicomponent Na+:H+ antiporter subunit E